MPVTADQVDVILKAQVAQYESNLRSADRTFTTVTNNTVRNANRVNSAVSNMNVGNIAAQFQDIGVTAAMGMNPLIVALQQGTQLSAVLNESVGKGVSPVKALGTAFLQIINPVSLATIAIVALGVAALQAFGSILPASETANEAIKRHREELEGIVNGYSSAEDAVKQYFDAANRLPQGIATLRTEEQFKEIGQEVETFRAQIEAFANDPLFAKFGSQATLSMQQLARQFADGSITAEDFYLGLEDVKDELNLLEQAGAAIPGSTANMISAWQEGAVKAIAFGQAINTLVAASHALAGIATDGDLRNVLDLKSYIDEQDRLNAMTSEELALYKEIEQIKKEAGQFGITDEAAAALAERTLAAEARRSEIKKQMAQSGRADNSAQREYEREREALEDLMAAMALDAALLGVSNREKAIAIALSKANATATEEEKAAIAQMAGFIYDTEKAVKDLNKSSQEWATTMQSATRGFINDLIEGKSAAEAFSNVLSSIANKLIDVGLSNLFGSSGFNFGSIFGGARAMGGPVSSGKTYLVGENGPELFSPSSAGNITPNHELGGVAGFTFAPVVDARGADEAAVARLETGLRRLANDMVPTIRKEISSGPKKGRG